jgi:RNA polymerase sigma-70 factor, ECF subfamily
MNETVNVMLAKEGNPDAFRSLYQEHGDRIYQIAFRHTKSQADAEDIMQNTFIKAYRKIHTFRFDRSQSFNGWLNTICFNCTMDFFRKQKRRHRTDQISLEDAFKVPYSGNPGPEKQAESGQAAADIQDALSVLTPKQRLIFEMRYFQHMDIKSIAQILKCSQSNIKTHSVRALAKLKKTLEPVWGKP